MLGFPTCRWRKTIHRIVFLAPPTVVDIVCAYKSRVTIECKRNGFEGVLFQTSFYDHIIRSREDYEEHMRYIYENPMRWAFDELYTEE